MPIAAFETRVWALELSGAFEPRAAALARAAGGWWLDSALPDARCGRFSFAGADPWARITARGRRVTVEVLRAARPDAAPGARALDADPLEVLGAWLPPRPPGVSGPAAALPFAGGAVGVLGYELAEGLAPLAPLALAGADDLTLPDLAFGLVDRLLACDHASGRVFAVGLGMARDGHAAARRAEDAARAVAGVAPDPGGLGPAGPLRARDAGPEARTRAEGAFLDESSHAKAVAAVRRRIEAGDVYQACLTHPIELRFRGDPWAAYVRLRRASPAPFAAWLRLPGVDVASSSPERFLALSEDGRVESRPIKGTRPRRADPVADCAEAAALRASEKDRAENVMIVDLVRNDLGRVCAVGSVHVPELFALERTASVHHLVSTVRGRLGAGADVFDLIRASFPPGSMTGAPKRAAMELLARLEPARRGFYAGALGYLDARGGADLSVVIRTALFARGRVRFHTGGGIVADSEAGAEWREAEDKVRALRAVLAEA